MVNRIVTDIARAITPPNLLRIDRRIVYANRMYHSGWMCTKPVLYEGSVGSH